MLQIASVHGGFGKSTQTKKMKTKTNSSSPQVDREALLLLLEQWETTEMVYKEMT